MSTQIQVTPVAASGVWGISNASGVYTYYATLALAMAAATAGQTIELFADVTETGAVTITLKDGVTINGNGHTYNHTQSGNSNTFNTSSAAGTFRVYNLNIIRTNATGGVVLVSGGSLSSPLQTFYLDGTTVTCNNTAVYTSAYYTVRKFYNLNIIITGSGPAISQFQDSINAYNFNIRALSTCTAVCISGVEAIFNSNIEHEGSPAGFAIIANSTLYDCNVISRGSTPCIATNGRAYNTLFYCAAGSCTYVNNIEFNLCTFISAGGYGTYTEATTYYKNCSVISTANYGVVGGTFYNSSIISSVNVASYNPILENCVSHCLWNNSGGHSYFTNQNNLALKNCSFKVTNTSANCLNTAIARTVKYANNAFDGATTPVNANITQGIINTQDNQGNILI